MLNAKASGTLEEIGDRAELFASHAPAYRIPARAEVCRQGDSPTHVYLLEVGIIGLTYTSPNGREFIVGLRSPGWILGAAAAILGRPWTVSATTLQVSQLRALPTKTFLEILNKEADSLARQILVMHSREIYAQIDRMVALALLSTRQRLEEFFWDFASKEAGQQSVRLPLNRGELAQYILTTRQHLNRVLHALEDDGAVQRSNGRFLLDRSRLWHRDTVQRWLNS
jgi:CRP-like cAMP-binding protein